jgi:hypothetical protein
METFLDSWFIIYGKIAVNRHLIHRVINGIAGIKRDEIAEQK